MLFSGLTVSFGGGSPRLTRLKAPPYEGTRIERQFGTRRRLGTNKTNKVRIADFKPSNRPCTPEDLAWKMFQLAQLHFIGLTRHVLACPRTRIGLGKRCREGGKHNLRYSRNDHSAAASRTCIFRCRRRQAAEDDVELNVSPRPLRL